MILCCESLLIRHGQHNRTFRSENTLGELYAHPVRVVSHHRAIGHSAIQGDTHHLPLESLSVGANQMRPLGLWTTCGLDGA